MMEHEKQLDCFWCYEAAVDAVYSALCCEEDGWIAHENYDVVRLHFGPKKERQIHLTKDLENYYFKRSA